MNELMAFFDLPWTHALGWTLLHSLWQGILIALVWRLLILIRTDAQSRYSLSVLALLTLAIVVALTFFWQLNHIETVPSKFAEGSAVAQGASERPVFQYEATEVFSWQQFAQNWTQRLQYFLPYLVMVWLLGATFLGFRLAGGWFYLQYLRQNQVRSLPAEWQKQFQGFARQMGIRPRVQILESRLIEHPLTLGHFKPVILIPLGMLSGLQPEQLEALIMHELAHIRRADYLVNLLQSFIETVLFFHPAVWWISGQVRESREHCCDDLALQQGQDRWEYAQALLQLNKQTVTFKSPLAMSALGNKHSQLTRRIQRLFGPPRIEHLFTRMMVLVLLLSGSLITWAFNPPQASPSGPLDPVEQILAPSQSEPLRISPQSTKADLKRVQMELEPHGVIIESITEIKGQGITELVISNASSEEPLAINDFTYIDFELPTEAGKNVKVITDGAISVEWESPLPIEKIEEIHKGENVFFYEKPLEQAEETKEREKDAVFFPAKPLPETLPENEEEAFFEFKTPDGVNVSPLIAVEGKLLDPQPEGGIKGLFAKHNIEPDQIESMNVCKGPSAIEKFGDGAQNGVIDFVFKPEVKLSVEPQKAPPLIAVEGKLLDPQPAMDPDAFLKANGIEPEMIETVNVWKAKNGADVVDITLKPGVSLPSQSSSNEFYFDSQFANPNLKVYPNPGQELIKAEFQLEKEAPVKLSVFDLNGKKIQVLSEQTLAPGPHRFEWQADKFASGAYIIRLEAGGKIWQEKVILE